MKTPTPPSRKVAKPKKNQALRTAASAKPTVATTPAPASQEPASTPVTAADAPTFIDSEKQNPDNSQPQQSPKGKKWQSKEAPVTPTANEATPATNEMGPQTRHLTLLGNKTVYSDRYTPAILEAFDNRHPENDYFVKFNCPEFTSLCPITGQPDFATIYISYIPDKKMVESKSLKLYLFSFRNHGAFHEDCVNIIMKDLIKLMSPRYIEVWGKFLPRGGLSIDPYANYGRPTTRWEEFARQRLLMHDLTPETVTNR